MFCELPEKAATWPNRPSTSTLRECPAFDWHDSNEDSPQNRTAYMHHLQHNILLPGNYIFGGVQPIRNLLDVEFMESATNHGNAYVEPLTLSLPKLRIYSTAPSGTLLMLNWNL